MVILVTLKMSSEVLTIELVTIFQIVGFHLTLRLWVYKYRLTQLNFLIFWKADFLFAFPIYGGSVIENAASFRMVRPRFPVGLSRSVATLLRNHGNIGVRDDMG